MWFNLDTFRPWQNMNMEREPKVLEKLQAAPEFWAFSLEECGAQSDV